MGQSSPTVGQLRDYLRAYPKTRLVSRENIKDFCEASDSNAYRAFLTWIREAGIAYEQPGKGRKQPVAAWPAGQLVKASETKKEVDPNKAIADFHELISDIWLKKAVKLLAKELPSAIVQFMRKHPRGFLAGGMISVFIFCGALALSAFVTGVNYNNLSETEKPQQENQDYGLTSLKKRYYSGEDTLSELNEYIEELDHGEEKAKALALKATMLNHRGEIDEALDASEYALRSFESLKNYEELFKSRVQTAKIYTLKHDFENAKHQMYLASRFLQEVTLSKQAYYFSIMSRIAQSENDDNKALEYARKALILYDESGLEYFSFDARTKVVFLLVKSCRMEEAQYHISLQTMMENDVKEKYFVFFLHHQAVERIYFRRLGRDLPTPLLQKYLGDTYNPNLSSTYQAGFEWEPCGAPNE